MQRPGIGATEPKNISSPDGNHKKTVFLWRILRLKSCIFSYSRKDLPRKTFRFFQFRLNISLLVLLSLFLLCSCSPEIKIKIYPPEKQPGTGTSGLIFPGEIGFSAIPTKTASEAINRFAGVPEGESLFSEDTMKETLKGSNFNLIQFSSGKNGSISFTISTKDLNSSFKDYSEGEIPEIISLEQKNDSGTIQNIAEISINPENLNTILAHFPPETRDYIDILMAPVFTGEDLTTEEYIQLIKAAYGEKLAGELSGENLNLELEFPSKNLKIFLNGEEKSLSGNNLTIPLADFLTMSKGFSIKMVW